MNKKTTFKSSTVPYKFRFTTRTNKSVIEINVYKDIVASSMKMRYLQLICILYKQFIN